MRASTKQQDANRAKEELKKFVGKFEGLRIATYYVENISATKIERPELMRLIDEAAENDILLIENIDRLTRLPAAKWEILKGLLLQKKIRVVVINLASTHVHMTGTFENRYMEVINTMFLDLTAEVAYEQWKRREEVTKQGIDKAKREGKYKGRIANKEKHQTLIRLFSEKATADKVAEATGYTVRHCYQLKKKYIDEINDIRGNHEKFK